jgi:hypothetical protein
MNLSTAGFGQVVLTLRARVARPNAVPNKWLCARTYQKVARAERAARESAGVEEAAGASADPSATDNATETATVAFVFSS